MRNPRESGGHVTRGPRKDVRHRKSTGNAATGTGNWTQRSLLLPVRSLAQEGTVSALYRLGHALMLSAQTVHIFLVSDSHPNTASPPRTHPPILALPLRGRPIARDPGTGGPGFSIASPRPCCKSEQLKMARPSGASFSPKKASLPVTPPPLGGESVFGCESDTRKI
jgi:hypothetical protein